MGYGVLRYLCGEDLPQAEVVFNYLGQFDQSASDIVGVSIHRR